MEKRSFRRSLGALFLLFLPLGLFASLGACGARSSLEPGPSSEAEGGAATSASSSVASASVTTGTGLACIALALHDPAVFIGPGISQTIPRLGITSDGDVLATLVSAPDLLLGSRFDPTAPWPPGDLAWQTLTGNVEGFVMGPGSAGPVGLVKTTGSDPRLVRSVESWGLEPDAFPLGSDLLFATGLPDRFLYGASSHPPDFHNLLEIGSYQSGSLGQVESPNACASTPLLADAVATDEGFLAAFAESASPSCSLRGIDPANVLSVARYDAPTAPGSFLSFTEAQHTEGPEPYAHVLLSAISSGAWLVTQTDGSTSRVPPPIIVRTIDKTGHPTSAEMALPTAHAQIGSVAVASLGDDAVVGWLDVDDGAVTTLFLNLVSQSGSVLETSFDVQGLPTSGDLHLVVSPDQRSIFAAWREDQSVEKVILARFDCQLGD